MIGSSFNKIYDLVKYWQPRHKYRSEAKYRDDLAKYLDYELNQYDNQLDPFSFQNTHHKIKTERTIGRDRIDISINDTIGIEMKYNFTGSDYRRLDSQIPDYSTHHDIIIVGCGIKDWGSWETLRQRYTERGMLIGGTQIQFIEK